jgi:hypothetical protein
MKNIALLLSLIELVEIRSINISRLRRWFPKTLSPPHPHTPTLPYSHTPILPHSHTLTLSHFTMRGFSRPVAQKRVRRAQISSLLRSFLSARLLH